LPPDQIMRPTAILRDDPKLARIADALRDAFGSRLVSALLFGSRARGDHRTDSDYEGSTSRQHVKLTRPSCVPHVR
jgi:hypothetical protein